MQILSRLRGLVAPTTGDQPLRLADGGGGGGGGSPLTTKGDLFGFDTADNRIPVGTDGQVLTADSTAPLGVSYQTPTTGAPLDMDDGTTTVNNVTLINVTGATLSSPSAGVADLAITGGGGGGGGILPAAFGGGNVVTPSGGWTLTTNGGTATASVGSNGEISISASNVSAPFPFGYSKAYAGGDFDVKLYLTNPTVANWGFFLRDSSTGNVIAIGASTASPSLFGFTSSAGSPIGTWSFASSIGSFSNPSAPAISFDTVAGWVRFTRVGNVYSMFVSIDGDNWVSLGGGVTTTFAASPDQFGLFFNVDGASFPGFYKFWSLSGI